MQKGILKFVLFIVLAIVVFFVAQDLISGRRIEEFNRTHSSVSIRTMRNVRGDVGNVIVELRSYDSRTGRATIAIRNSSTRHINIQIQLVGEFGGQRLGAFSDWGNYAPGETVETIQTRLLHSTGSTGYADSISSLRISGSDLD